MLTMLTLLSLGSSKINAIGPNTNLSHPSMISSPQGLNDQSQYINLDYGRIMKEVIHIHDMGRLLENTAYYQLGL